MLCKLSATKKNGVSNVGVNPTLAKINSSRVRLVLDPGHGHLGTSSAHLAALWMMGLVSVLSGGDLVLLPARMWFWPSSPLWTLILMPWVGTKAGAALWDSFASSWLLLLQKGIAIYTVRAVKQGKKWALCVIELYPLRSRYTVLYNTAKHRTIQDSFASDIFKVPTAVHFT